MAIMKRQVYAQLHAGLGAAHDESVRLMLESFGRADFAEGVQWCRDHPDALADGGYRLAKEAIILYGMANAVTLGARGIRINCTGPGVTETPILDQLRTRYGQDYLDGFPKPLGRVSNPAEQAAALVFLNSAAAGFVTGQVLWVDGGNLAACHFPLTDEEVAERVPSARVG